MQNYLRANSTRRVASVSLAAITVIAAAVGVTIWRYQVAQSDGAAAVATSHEASNAKELIALFWHEREAMNEYLFGPSQDLTAEIGKARQTYIRTAAAITPATSRAARSLGQARTGDTKLMAAFEAVKGAAGTLPVHQQAANDHIVLAERRSTGRSPC